MDANLFDTLALRVARLTTRRAISRLVLGLPALAAVIIGDGLGPTTVGAEDDDHGSSHRRRRRKTRHKHRKNTVRRNKKHKKRKPNTLNNSTPRCTPRTCPASGCGPMADGCGGTLQCGGCGSNQVCVDGTCQACDVCQPPGACAFDSVQAAINATDPQLETIVVCPGTYVENATDFEAIRITRNLRLVGAGDGSDPATNTILRPDHDNQHVVLILRDAVETPHVTPHVALERVRLTGATETNGDGLHIINAVVDLIGCTITGNGDATTQQPGGLFAYSTTLTLTDTRVTGNTGSSAGGMYAYSGGQITFDTLSRVTDNIATGDDFGFGFGGIRAESGTSVALPSAANVTGNNSTPDTLPNCGGGGSFTGAGKICAGS